jgi:dCMP deaminase
MSFLNNIINKKERLSWDEYFISIAVLTSLRSPSSKKKVGSVIVKDNRIIATGYNGYPQGAPHASILIDGHEVNTIHAEQNAISQCSKMGISSLDSTIYVTHFPCLNCAKMIVGSGIKEIVYLENYHNHEVAKLLFDQGNIKIRQFNI